MAGMPEIASLAHTRNLAVDLVAGTYFAIGALAGIDRLRGLAERVQGSEHWDRLAVRRVGDDLFAGQRALAAQALNLLDLTQAPRTRSDGVAAANAWAETNLESLKRSRLFFTALEQSGEPSIAKLTLANSQIRQLASS
jgi:glutamate dehydrogenase